MINNNSGNKNKNITFYWPMYIFFNTNTGQCIFFIELFLSLIQVNVYFFNTNTGQCIFFIDLFYH